MRFDVSDEVIRVDFGMSVAFPVTGQSRKCRLSGFAGRRHRFGRASSAQTGAAIRSFPPNKQRGPRVDERRVPNGIFFIRTIAFDKERDLRGRDHGRKRDR
jgi:hypothetical protein